MPLGPVLLRPFSARRRDVERIADIAYGEHGVRNLLDVYVRRDRPQGAPVLVYLHGGAWVTGKKNQGRPIIYHFAHDGWLCVAPNYRLGPDATFPDQLIDVKRVLAWVQDHAAEHGGDPTTVFLAGGSAGGHLTALAALTANDPSLQPGFEDADTRVAAAIPLYGDYDWLDTHHERERRGLDRTRFLVERVLKCTSDEDRARWELGSPLYHVRSGRPAVLRRARIERHAPAGRGHPTLRGPVALDVEGAGRLRRAPRRPARVRRVPVRAVRPCHQRHRPLHRMGAD